MLRDRLADVNAEKPFLVACIPAVNEEKNLARVILLAQRHVDKVIVCNDGSSDLTGEIARRLGAEVIDHEKNMGYGASLRSLFSKARHMNADLMVTLDADGQHDASNIPTLIDPVIQGKADVVIGSRFLNEEGKNNVPTYRRKGIALITSMARTVSFNHITDAQSGYRAYSKKALSLIDPTEFGLLRAPRCFGFYDSDGLLGVGSADFRSDQFSTNKHDPGSCLYDCSRTCPSDNGRHPVGFDLCLEGEVLNTSEIPTNTKLLKGLSDW